LKLSILCSGGTVLSFIVDNNENSMAIDVWKNSIYLKKLNLTIHDDSLESIKEDKVFQINAKDIELDTNNLWRLQEKKY